MTKIKSLLLPVGQRGDYKTVSAAQELILINEVNISDGHNDLIQVLLEVKSALLQPFKVISRFYMLFHLQAKKDYSNSQKLFKCRQIEDF